MTILAALFLSVGLATSIPDDRVVSAEEVIITVKTTGSAYFDDCIIVGDLDLSKLKIDKIAHFNNTIFQNSVNFSSAIFGNTTFFSDAVFSRSADFEYASFCHNADFSHVDFTRRANFEGSVFKADSDFKYAVFSSSANFENVAFSKDADFDSAAFNERADFKRSVFYGEADFEDVAFNKRAYFDGVIFKVDADFNGAAFDDDANFWNTFFDGDADFEEVMFKGDVDFNGAAISGRTDFESSIFSGNADFRSAGFNGTMLNFTYFTAVQFNREANFEDAYFSSKAFFDNVGFKEDALFENAIFKDELNLIRARYSKLFIRWHSIEKGGLVYDDAAYMSLMKNFKDLGYYEDYDGCYYAYRKAHRSQEDWPSVPDWEEAIRKLIDYPLQWFYGYGTKPFHAFFWSLGIVMAFFFYWRWLGLGGPRDKTKEGLKDGEEWLDGDLTDILGYSVTVFLSGTKFFIDPPALPRIEGRSRSWMKKAFILERVLGALFSVLFFIAISGTIVRAS